MKHAHRGFSLVEVLVALAVMATGLLAVATFQTDLISGSGTNKARSEALALAQARIEQFRNYTMDVDSRTEFDTLFSDTNNTYVTENDIAGTNATFTPKYAISGGASAVKTIEVRVEWTDKLGEAYNVTLNTRVGWEPPRSAGDVVNETRGNLVPSATGRAYLGEGTLPDDATTTDNGDGTKVWEDGDDLKLAVGTDIVLTLEDACQTQTCIDFVKIKGLVYIDTASAGNVDPGDVYVKASDAAYCHRYYLDAQNHAVDVVSTTTSAEITANGDYKYFYYTCYLGGGWHGNVGILLSGGIQQTDKICQGDPTSADAWADPVISARRVYRGMLYKIDNSNASGKEEIAGSNHLVRYYSVGIADSTELPVPGSGQATHDFVISSMSVGDTTGDKCITASNGSAGPMMRTDANANGTDGDLFAGMPTDFVCLNPSYVDTFDSSVYGVENTCPFDPSDPPSLRYGVSGTVTVTGDSSFATQVAAMNVVTSDGAGNCTVDSFTYASGDFVADYTCDIFDWGSGWTGYVEVKPNSDEIGCSVNRLTHSAVSQDLSNEDFQCVAGNIVYISGSVSVPMHHQLLSAAIDGDADRCTVTLNNSSGDYDYECNTANIDAMTETWSGTITFLSNDGVICHPNGPETNPSDVTYTSLSIGRYTDNFTIERNTSQCPYH